MKPNESKHLKLNDLVPHPAQSRNYGAYDPESYSRLKADIARKGGIEKPIEVMPRGNAAGLATNTIVAGHTRRRILLELAHVMAPVVVRHDLVGATAAEVESVLIADNLNRRQETKLARARHAVSLFKLRSGRECVDPMRVPGLRDEIGAILGMSGRNLARYLSLLSSPSEVQEAYERGEIPLTVGARVGGLAPSSRAEIGQRLEAGEPAGCVIAEYLAPPRAKHQRATPPFLLLIAAAGKALDDLEGRTDKVFIEAIRANSETLLALRAAVDEWLDRLDTDD